MNEINNGLGMNTEEGKKKQTFGTVQPKKKGSARKKVATAVVATAMVVAAIAVPTVIKLNSNKGYTVTLQYNMHGELLGDNTSINLKKGSVVGDIQVPSKPGYVFVEFCSDAECTKSLAADTVVSENLTIYLHYVAINYTFASLPEGVSVTHENNAVIPGDYEDNTTTKLGYGAVLTVEYKLPAGHHVTVNANNTQGLEKVGEVVTTTDAQGTTYTVQYKVVGSGATETEEERISINYAYEINEYTLTFVSDGEVFATTTRAYGQYVDSTPIATPSKEATISHVYTFVGWSTDENADPDDEFAMVDLSTTQVTANTTYYAIYRESARKYNLTLNDAVPPECVIISMNQGGTWTDVGHPSTLAYGTELVVIYKAQEGYSITESEIASGLEDTKKVAIIDGVSYPVYKVVGDVSIVYSQEINSYTVGAISSGVTVKHNGERVTTGAKLNHGSVVEISYELNPGYSLTSFEVMGAEEQEDGTFKVTGVLKVTLKQAINTYTVTFNDYNGTLIKTQTVDWGASASITAPTRPADSTYTYAFAGWVDSEGSTVDLTNITANTTVYASYTPIYINYTLSIRTNIATNGTLTVTDAEGNTLTNGSKIHNGDVLHISFVESDGHTGTLTTTGLTENADGSYTINGDAGVTYAEEINTYTVTFLDYDGNKLGEQTVNWGTGASIADPTREGNKTYTYTFANWVTEKGGTQAADLSNITANTTVYARYTEEYVKYTISIPRGVTVKHGEEPVTTETELHYNDTLTISYTLDEGYELDELKVLGAEENGGVYTLTDNITITYTQKLKEYTLTTTGISGTLTIKDEANNTYTNGSKVKHFTTLTVEYTPREGYHISNLTVNGKEITSGSTITVTGTTSIVYAEAINTYTVTFKDYDGTTYATKTVDWGTGVTVENPTRPEDEENVYEFMGWVTEQGGTYTANLNDIREDTTVYAWYGTIQIYHATNIPTGVTIKRGEEEVTATTRLFFDDNLTITYALDEGYELDTFYVEGTMEIDGFYRVSGDVSITFTQRLKEYSITTQYVAEGGISGGGTLTLTDETGNTYGNGTNIKHFTKLKVEYTAGQGYHTTTLTVNGKSIISGDVITVTGDVSIEYAEAINTYTVTFKDYDGSLITEKTVNWGSGVSVETPTRVADKVNTYTFVGWVTEKGGTAVADLSVITADVTVYASYYAEAIKYTLSIPSGVTVKNGDNVLNAQTGVTYGELLTITYEVDEGYEVDEFTVIGATEQDGKYLATGDITITYTQKLKEYTLTTTGTSGTLTITDEAGNTYTNGSKVKHFTTLTVEYTPREGYHTTSLTVNGKEITSGSTITVTGEVSIAYAEEINKYTVTYYDEDRTTVLHTTTVNYNGVVVYTETPTKEADNRYTYEFKSWTNAEGGTAVFTNIKADTSYYATYTATYIEYAVGEIPAGVEVYYLTGTSTQYSGETKLSASSNIHYGDSVRFVYTSTEGHHYKAFSVDNLNVTKEETNRKTATIEGTIGGEIAIHCTEEIDTVTVTFLNYDGTNLGTQSVDWGTGVSFATPDRVATDMYNYTFTGWVTEDGEPANLTQVTADITVKASFAENYQVYTLSLTNNMKAYYVTGTSEYTENEELTNKAGLHYGDKIRLEYTASEGNHITGVNITGATQDGDAETTATNVNGEETAGYVIATVSRDITASFTQAIDQYVLTWDSANVKVYKVTMLDTSGHSGSGRSAKLKSATLKSVDHNGGGDDSSGTTSSLTEIHSGDSVSYGDVIRVVYTASENYGKTEFNVTGLTITSSSTDSEETGYIQGTVNNKPTIAYAEEVTLFTVNYTSDNVKVYKVNESTESTTDCYTTTSDDYWSVKEDGTIECKVETWLQMWSTNYSITATKNMTISFDYSADTSWYGETIISINNKNIVGYGVEMGHAESLGSGHLTIDLFVGDVLTFSSANYNSEPGRDGDPDDLTTYVSISNIRVSELEQIANGEKVTPGEVLKFVYNTPIGYEKTNFAVSGIDATETSTDSVRNGYITGAATGNIVVNYAEVEQNYTVTIGVNDSTYGSVSQTSISVPSGSSISVSGSSITVNGTTVTATAASSTAQYNYYFNYWSCTDGQTITKDTTITANFRRNTRSYTITIATNNINRDRIFTSGGTVGGTTSSNYGSVSRTSISVPYGSTISVSGNKITINGTTITATAASSTSQYTYAFSSWSNTSGTVTGARTITANFTRTTRSYTVTIKANNSEYGTVDTTTLSVPYGSSVSVSGNKITINGEEITATAATATAEYEYSFSGWSNTSGTITGTRTITANFTQTLRSYTVTWDSANVKVYKIYNYGISTTAPEPERDDEDDTDPTIPTGNYEEITSGTTLHYGDVIWVSANASTGYNKTTFMVSGIEETENYGDDSYGVIVGSITGNVTINYSESIQMKTVTLQANNSAYGSVSSTSISVPYGSTVSVSNNKLTVNGQTITATPTTSDAQYTYTFTGWSVSNGTTITSSTTITANFTQTLRSYTVTWDSANVKVYKVNNYGVSVAIQSISSDPIVIDPTGNADSHAPTGNYEEITSGTTLHYGDVIWVSANASTGYNKTTFMVSGIEETENYGDDSYGVIVGSITGNVTINYTQTKQVKTVQYYNQDGSQLLYTAEVEYGDDATYIGTTPTKEANNTFTYNFVGWSTSKNATSSNVTLKNVTDNKVVYAAFSEVYIEYSIGNIPSQVTVRYMSGTSSYQDNEDLSSNCNIHFGDYLRIYYNVTTGYTTTEFEILGVNITHEMPGGTCFDGSVKGNVTIVYSESVQMKTITLQANNSAYGSVSSASLSVPYGSTISVSGNKLSINGQTITATATTSDAQYSYAFSSWSNTSGTVTGARTITANFTRTTNNYTVTIASSNTSYGTVSSSSISVPYGSTISVSGNKITINGNTITATAATNTAQYSYAFSGWSVNNGATITGNSTITANFSRRASATEGLTYTVVDGGYAVSGYTGSDTDIFIPETYNGKAVVGIADNAFYNKSTITSVEIPDSVTYIGTTDGFKSYQGAFANCSNLERVIIGSGVKYVAPFTFNSSSKINYVNFNGTLEQWLNINWEFKYLGAEYTATYRAKGLHIQGVKLSGQVVIPEGVTEIPNFAFIGCEDITSIILPSTLTKIGSKAFEGTSFTNVTIPSGVTTIGSRAFEGTKITTITIPSTVKSIENMAFRSTALQSIYIESMEVYKALVSRSACGEMLEWTSAIPYVLKSVDDGSNAYLSEYFTKTTSGNYNKYVQSSYKVEFYNGSTLLQMVKVEKNGTAVYTGSTPTKAGDSSYDYTFKGWGTYNGSTSTISLTNITSDRKLYAVFNKTEKVAYEDVNGLRCKISGSSFSISEVIDTDRQSYTIPLYYNGKSINFNEFDISIFQSCYNMKKIVLEFSEEIGNDFNFYIQEMMNNAIFDNISALPEGRLILEIDSADFVYQMDSMGFLSGVSNLAIRIRKDIVDSTFGDLSSYDERYEDGEYYVYTFGYGDYESVENTFTYEYTSYSDGYGNTYEGWFITGIENLIDPTNVVIPAYYNGEEVVGIMAGAFSNYYEIESVTISDGFKVIGNEAFSNCENLKHVYIPGSVESIDDYAFMGCINLENVTMSLENHSGSRYIGTNAFYDCIFTTISGVSEDDYNQIYNLINDGSWQFGSSPFPPDSEFGGI